MQQLSFSLQHPSLQQVLLHSPVLQPSLQQPSLQQVTLQHGSTLFIYSVIAYPLIKDTTNDLDYIELIIIIIFILRNTFDKKISH